MTQSLRISVFWVVFCLQAVNAQQNEADSLRHAFSKTKDVNKKVVILGELSWYYYGVYNDSALLYARRMNQEAVKTGDAVLEGNSYKFMGMAYERLSDYPNALKYQQEALSLYKKAKNKEGIANASNNIGNIYQHLKEYEQALTYQQKALDLCYELKIEGGIAACLGNMGNIYKAMGQVDTALAYYNRSLAMDRKNDNPFGASNSLSNIGGIYKQQRQFDSAEAYYNRCLKIRTELGMTEGMAGALNSLAEVAYEKNHITSARERYEKASQLAQEAKATEILQTAYNGLYMVFKKTGKTHEALKYHELASQLNDSIYNASKSEAISQLKTTYALEQQEELMREQREQEKREQEKKEYRLQVIISAVIAGLILIAIFSYFIFNRWRHSQRQRKIIELQKMEVEEKNKQITDSIRYAKTIQQALMPREDEFCQQLGNAFLFFAPRDIVSGDFYWMAPVRNKNQLCIAIADCTGHGVPGGFMSVLGSSALNEIVNEMHIDEPAEVLNHLRERIKNAMGSGDSQSKARDGMDISFLRLDKSTGTLTYAGANSHIYIVRNGDLMIYEGDKMPIGYFLVDNQFRSHTIQLQKSDMVYAFTDGYADQFGGPSGKKFMYRKLIDLLKSLAGHDLMYQRNEVIRSFNQWKGPEEQVDDVCLMGFRYA
jgi:serine phosphatase RsbU (regulator of sigma subunit)/Tfp pilus assembly protein PilF